MNFPNTLGACVDAALKMRDERLAIEKKVEKLREQEAEINAFILSKLSEAGVESARGQSATASIQHTIVPKVLDWDVFYKHIIKTKQIDLLERRPAKGACAERFDAGEKIPGVEQLTLTKLSLTKSSK